MKDYVDEYEFRLQLDKPHRRRRRLLLLVVSMLLVCGALWLCWGCTSLMQKPVQRATTLSLSPADAYTHAAHAFTRLPGAQLRVADAHSRTLSGVVHDVVVLNVSVSDKSTVQVTGTLIPGKIVAGSFTDVDDYVALLTGESHGQ